MDAVAAQQHDSDRFGQTIGVVGPTASGKSDVAMALAERMGGEIVSCDSVQVYRGFQVGCAKPSAADQARVPHHLLDVADWHAPFDAQRYRLLAQAAIASIHQRGRVAIVCGGTGLYLRALRFGLMEMPATDPALRAALFAEEDATPGVLYARLQQLDRESAQQIEPRNHVQVVRALEITITTGQPASALRRAHGFRHALVPMRVVSLLWPNEILRERINARCEAMLTRMGWIDEVKSLLAQGVSPHVRPMMAVGYKEVCAHVLAGADPTQLPALMAEIQRNTWQYARRQRTWFRRETQLINVDLAPWVSHGVDTWADACLETLWPIRHG